MKTVELPSELTAENGAKALLSYEFHETIEIENPNYDPNCDDEDDEDSNETILLAVPVSWTTIKAIYGMIVANLAVKGVSNETEARVESVPGKPVSEGSIGDSIGGC